MVTRQAKVGLAGPVAGLAFHPGRRFLAVAAGDLMACFSTGKIRQSAAAFKRLDSATDSCQRR